MWLYIHEKGNVAWSLLIWYLMLNRVWSLCAKLKYNSMLMSLWSQIQVFSRCSMLREAFLFIDSTNAGYLNLDDLCLAYRSATNQELNPDWVDAQRNKNCKYAFEEFCCIWAEFRSQVWRELWNGIINCLPLKEVGFSESVKLIWKLISLCYLFYGYLKSK